MKIAQTILDNEFVTVEMQEHAADQTLRFLARTNPARQIRQIWYRKLTQQRCYWTDQRWARLVRWLNRKKWTSWLIPYPLLCFANAIEVVLAPAIWEIPEEVDDSIKAQLANASRERPKMIIVGVESHHDLISSKHFSIEPISNSSDTWTFTIYDLPVYVTDKLEEDAVIVL